MGRFIEQYNRERANAVEGARAAQGRFMQVVAAAVHEVMRLAEQRGRTRIRQVGWHDYLRIIINMLDLQFNP